MSYLTSVLIGVQFGILQHPISTEIRHIQRKYVISLGRFKGELFVECFGRKKLYRAFSCLQKDQCELRELPL